MAMRQLTQPNRSSIVLWSLGLLLMSLGGSPPSSATDNEKTSIPRIALAQSSPPQEKATPKPAPATSPSGTSSADAPPPVPTISAERPVGEPISAAGSSPTANPTSTAPRATVEPQSKDFDPIKSELANQNILLQSDGLTLSERRAELLALARELVASNKQVLPGQLTASDLARTQLLVNEVTRVAPKTATSSVIQVAGSTPSTDSFPSIPSSSTPPLSTPLDQAHVVPTDQTTVSVFASPQISSKVPPSP